MEVIKNDDWFESPNDITEFFMDEGKGQFECGQGYYEDTAQVIVDIKGSFYLVTLRAEIGSQKQDMGDRLYWVDEVEEVKWRDITSEEMVLLVNQDITVAIEGHKEQIERLERGLIK